MNRTLLARAVLGVALVEHLGILYPFPAPVPEHHDCMTAGIQFLFGVFLVVLGAVNALVARVTYQALHRMLGDRDLALLCAAAPMALAPPLLLLATMPAIDALGWFGLLTPFAPYLVVVLTVWWVPAPRSQVSEHSQEVL